MEGPTVHLVAFFASVETAHPMSAEYVLFSSNLRHPTLSGELNSVSDTERLWYKSNVFLVVVAIIVFFIR